jgi:hypothetical protein
MIFVSNWNATVPDPLKMAMMMEMMMPETTGAGMAYFLSSLLLLTRKRAQENHNGCNAQCGQIFELEYRNCTSFRRQRTEVLHNIRRHNKYPLLDKKNI